jgi:hypothetical protein
VYGFLVFFRRLLFAASPHVPILFQYYACGNYAVIFQILSSSDWPHVYERTFADAAVNQLTSVVTDALNKVVPFTRTKISSSAG